jgi:hypothetical protein
MLSLKSSNLSMIKHPHYVNALSTKSDIREHLGILNALAMDCYVVVELGFRTGISTTAFLAAGATVHSYDIKKNDARVRALAKQYKKFNFWEGDSRRVDIPKCDLLFVDTDHTWQTTFSELSKHHAKVKRWVVLHDTVTYGRKDPSGKEPGIMDAIEDFIDINPQWKIKMHLRNSNGLTILEKVE